MVLAYHVCELLLVTWYSCVDEGTDNAGQEFAITHGWISATSPRPSLAGFDTQRWDVSVYLAHFTL